MLSQTPFLGCLYPFTFSPLWSGVWECNARTVCLGNLLGCLHPLTLVLCGAEFEVQRAETYPVVVLFLFDLAKGWLWRFECVNADCPVLLANLLPFGADYATA